MKYQKTFKAFMFVCLCCMATILFAQKPQGDATILVKVTIVDVDKNPLPGATVKVTGKAQGVVANDQGEVSLWVDRNTQIEFKYVGMKSLFMRVTKPLSGYITLEDETSELDQVVVTGYQRTTKRRTTGSLATLTAKDLKGAPTANLDMLMQGKVAGMDVKAVSGRPGESAKIRIRGTNTITGNAEPLWVVDGVPLQKDIPSISSSQIRAGDFNEIFANGISGINPNDIESITVLKDASATAIYGSRAAGGVIVVTTKRGKEGKMSINYSANVSIVTRPPGNANLMNSSEKLAWEQELWNEFSAKGFADGTHYPVIGAVGMIRSGYGKYANMTLEQQNAEIARLGEQTTDWFDELFQNSVSNSHYLSLSGGSEKNSYYVSLGYAKNNGLVKKTDYERYNVSAKLDMKPNKRVKLGISADMAIQESTSPSLNVDPFKYAYFANPYERIYNEDGSYAADNTYYSITHANGAYDKLLPDGGYNIFREINETSNETKNMSASLIANLSVNILDNLSFEGLASYGYVTNASDNINGKNTYAAWQDRPFEGSASSISKRTYGSITQTNAYNTNYNLRGQLHYFNTFGRDHYISALLGSEIRGQYSKSIYEKRYGYDPISGNSSIPIYPESMDIGYNNLISYAAIVDQLSGQSIVEDAFASFYLSLDYVFKQRYILSLTGRTDGSNNFGSNEQFNPTGSVGLSWNVDQEEFMKPLKPIISTLSLRSAFGYTGNINKSVYPQLVMDYENSFRKADNDYYRMGTLRNAPGTHEDMKRIEEEGRLDEWCADNLKYFADTFGKENIVAAHLHRDEETPHIHVTLVPIVKGERKRRKREEQTKKRYRKKPTDTVRLCADDIMTRLKLKSYQDTYAVAMAKYGLQRGIDGSKARHKSTQQYYRDIQKLADNLKAEVVDLQQQKETAREELRRAKKEIQTEKLKRAATTAAANIAKSVGSLFGSNKVKTLERENTALHREVADHEETIEACKIGYSPCRQTTAGRYGKCSRGTAGK